MQDDAQVFLAGSAAVRACLNAMKGSSLEQAGSLACEVVTALTEVCVSALYTRSVTVDSSRTNHACVSHPANPNPNYPVYLATSNSPKLSRILEPTQTVGYSYTLLHLFCALYCWSRYTCSVSSRLALLIREGVKVEKPLSVSKGLSLLRYSLRPSSKLSVRAKRLLEGCSRRKSICFYHSGIFTFFIQIQNHAMKLFRSSREE